MKAENLHSLERAERMMVRWMCGMSLKDRRHSENLYSFLGVDRVADVLRHGRLRWFGHLERKGVDDWVSACRNVVVAVVRCVGRGRKNGGVCERWHEVAWVAAWMGSVQGCMERQRLHSWGKCLTLAWHGTDEHFKNKWWWWCHYIIVRYLIFTYGFTR